MKLYLCGPMTGLPDNNYPVFAHAAEWLRDAGYEVVNPAEVVTAAIQAGQLPPEPSWSECMRTDIPALLQCDAIATLPGFEASRGAKLEIHIARELGMLEGSAGQWLAAKRKSKAVSA